MSLPAKVLIVGPAWVGDMVMAQSLFRLLRDDNAEAVIDVVAPAWSGPLLARMPEVRRAIELPLGHGEFGFGIRRRIGRALRDERYDHAIVLPRSFKAALVPWFARVPVRTGFRGELRYGLLNDVRQLDRNRLDQTVKRFIALGLPEGVPLPVPPQPRLQLNHDNLRRLAGELQLDPAGRPVALMPGAAYGPAKCWPIEHFGALAALLSEAGREVWILGSRGEAPVGEAIRAAGGPRVLNLCGRTRLEDSVDLLGTAEAAVTNDSGLMHVAAAAGTRVIAIYGSSSPTFTPPLTEQKHIHYLGLPCSPCFERDCPLGHLNCLRDIRPKDVLTSALAPG